MSRFKPAFRFRFSLAFKLILAMFFLVLLSAAAFTYFFFDREAALLRTQVTRYGKAIGKSLALSIEAGPALSDPALLQRLAQATIEDEDILFCSVFNAGGNRLAHASREENPSATSLSYRLTEPIHSKEGPIVGTIHIGISLSKLRTRIDELRRDILLVTLGLVGIGALFILAFTRVLLRPIGKLVVATRNVSKGELAQAETVRSKDELGDLARAFDEMVMEIKESRTELERKMEERTHQLGENIDELSRAKLSTQTMLEDLQSAKRELEMVNHELKEMDETKMKFIGIASHELKTPLTAIKANVDFILSERAGKIPEHLKSYLFTIQRNTNRIQMRMDHMLDLARIKSGRLLLYREPIAVSCVIPGYVNEIKPVDKRLSIDLEIPEALSVYADKNGFHDIFINLLSNAFKFTPDGGQVRVTAAQAEGSVLHAVRDTGIGIPEEEHEKIFEEFYQVESGKHGGSGLGLAITRRLVEAQGGTIWVESRVGQGSVFYFTLPSVSEDQDGKRGTS